LLECKTCRLEGHFVGDPQKYRNKDEITKGYQNEPIGNFEKRVVTEGLMKPEELEAIKTNVAKTVDEAVAFAFQSAYPDESDFFTDLYD
jgi:TPP-dependent pyruvate/acetoin dehydrogenase alpha subunit